MPPRVSVVLPAYNAAATIAAAVASIRAQTLTDWELIVVDDGSTDDTAKVVAAIARLDHRLTLLRESHYGVTAAANTGMTRATGEFVARMDADDVSLPERLARQAEFLASPANADIGVVSSLVAFGGDRAAREGYARHVDWLNTLVTPEAVALNRFIESPVANPSVMFRRELVAQHGAFVAGDFPEDYELWLRWLDAGVRMAKLPDVLLQWNDPPSRITRNDPRYAPEAFFRAKAPWVARELARLAESHGIREIYVWGAGRHTRKRAAHLESHGVRIAGYIDVDPKKTGRGLGGTGVPVLAEETVPAPGEVRVLGYVTTWGARDYIRTGLTGRGYVEGADFLMCA